MRPGVIPKKLGMTVVLDSAVLDFVERLAPGYKNPDAPPLAVTRQVGTLGWSSITADNTTRGGFGHAIGILHEHQAPEGATSGIERESGALRFGDGVTGRRLPSHTPDWSDFNTHDPGVSAERASGSDLVLDARHWGDLPASGGVVPREPPGPIILDEPPADGAADPPGFGAGLAGFVFQPNTAVGHRSPRDLARLVDYRPQPAGDGETTNDLTLAATSLIPVAPLLALREYLVRLFGQEIVSSEKEIGGGAFSDVIVATGENQFIDGGWGSDVIIADLAGNHTVDATRGDDTIVLGGRSVNELTTLVVDTESTLPTGKWQHKPTIVLKDIDPDSATIVELGDGVFEITDGDALALVRLVDPDGRAASLPLPVADVFTFFGEFPEPEDQVTPRPLLIVAEDVEGEALGTARSDVIFAGPLTIAVNGGGGDDVILHDLSAATVESAILNGGPGNDTYVLRIDESDIDPEIEDCLIFDFGSGGIRIDSGDSAALLGFGTGATIRALGNGQYLGTDDLGVAAQVGFEFEDGTALTIEQVRAVLLNADTFEFLREDGTVLPPDLDGRTTTDDLTASDDTVPESWDLML